MSKIAELWAQEIRAGRKALEEAPAKLIDEVKKILNEQGEAE